MVVNCVWWSNLIMYLSCIVIVGQATNNSEELCLVIKSYHVCLSFIVIVGQATKYSEELCMVIKSYHVCSSFIVIVGQATNNGEAPTIAATPPNPPYPNSDNEWLLLNAPV